MEQGRLVQALRNPALFGAGCTRVDVIETHISYVLLTGAHAYKIKKAVNLGFLDFTTLAARRFFAERELALNRRLAPDIYLDVLPITGDPDRPMIGGAGAPLEYALKMREFPQDALLSKVLARGELKRAHVDALAATIAAFHSDVERAGRGSPFGTPADNRELAVQNFTQSLALVADAPDRGGLERLRRWTNEEYVSRASLMASRHDQGFVRECHGDLHLGNIALIDDRPVVFDCIEFNDHMRWIDVMNDVAFTVMDLEDRQRPDFAARFLNGYLERTGDFGGLGTLRFYVVYRAMVRAKIALFRAQEDSAGSHNRAGTHAEREFHEYLALATKSTRPAATGLIIMHGLSGSGKTTVSQEMLERMDGIRIRTDIERKRLHGLAPGARSTSGINAGVYSPAATARTYERVQRLAEGVVDAGYVPIVDGAFLERRQRDRLRRAADQLHVPFVIVSCEAPADLLRQRVSARSLSGVDASEADASVLEYQLAGGQPLELDERPFAVTIDASSPLEAQVSRLHSEVSKKLQAGAS